MVLNNPLIKRYRFSILRPRQVLIFGIMYVTVIFLLLLINHSIFRTQHAYENVQVFFQSLYFQFLVFQVIFLWLWGAFNSNSAINEEVVNKSYEFFRMLPLPAWKKAVGTLIGKNLLVLLLSAINFVFLFMFGFLGKVNLILQLQVFFVLCSICVFSNIMALLASVSFPAKKKKSGSAIIILAMLFVMPLLVGPIFALADSEDFQESCIQFFGIDIPILWFCSLSALYFAFWAFKGVVRKFDHERDSLFTAKGAFLFAVGLQLYTLGIFWSFLGSEDFGYSLGFCVATFFPIHIIMLSTARSVDKYIECSRLMQKKQQSIVPALAGQSNLCVGLGLYLIWFVPAVCVLLFTGVLTISSLLVLLTLSTFCWFIMSIVEVHVLYNTTNSKAGWLIGFIFLLYLFLPIIFGFATGFAELFSFSPLSYFSVFPDRNYSIDHIDFTDIIVSGVNLFLCMLSGLVIFRRYHMIASTRELM